MRRIRLLNEQTALLLLSFVVSLSLWMYVTTLRTAESPQATTKVVAVVPAIVGEPAYGYTLLGIRITPQTVTLSGSPRALASVQNVITEPVNIAGVTRDFVQEVAVVAPPEVEVSGRVRVAVQVAAAVAVTTVRGIQIQPPRAPAGMSVSLQPSTVMIQIQGPVNMVNRLRAADFTARVDMVDFEQERQRAQVRVQAPPQIEVLSITPAGVTVTVKKGS